MEAETSVVIKKLCDSYRLQLGFYNALSETVQRILSRIILSRGDISGLKNDFAEKQRFLDMIQTERLKTAGQVKLWEQAKAQNSETGEARELDAVLRETEKSIRAFLDGEEQLKKHLERLMKRKA